MGRNSRSPGIILTSRRVGEYHKALEILLPEEGIVRATAYGAVKGKSRLAGVSEPFIEGEMYIYHDPVKDRRSLTELDPSNIHEAIWKDLSRYYIASSWVECIVKSFAGGGEFGPLFRLLSDALSILEKTERYEEIFVHFLWRYLALIGFRPDIHRCEECGTVIDRGETLHLEGTAFLCGRCAAFDEAELSVWGRRFLELSAAKPFFELIEILDEIESAKEAGKTAYPHRLEKLKGTIIILLRNIVDRPLNTLAQGLI
jgi:DNA repair protein RecO